MWFPLGHFLCPRPLTPSSPRPSSLWPTCKLSRLSLSLALSCPPSPHFILCPVLLLPQSFLISSPQFFFFFHHFPPTPSSPIFCSKLCRHLNWEKWKSKKEKGKKNNECWCPPPGHHAAVPPTCRDCGWSAAPLIHMRANIMLKWLALIRVQPRNDAGKRQKRKWRAGLTPLLPLICYAY